MNAIVRWFGFPVCSTALILLAAAPFPAQAGKNANGALVVHTNDAVNYTRTDDYCGVDFDDPGTCENARTRTDKDENTPAVIWFLAAFLGTSNPGVTVVHFGIDHNLPPGQGYFADWGVCGPSGSLEVPDGGWPESVTAGNSVGFSSPIVGDTLFPFYWFAAYGFDGAHFRSAENPISGYAVFVDDGNPPFKDLITKFGEVRWYGPGLNECPIPEPEACCFWDGRCEMLLEEDCLSLEGIWQGPNTIPVECDPDPCVVVCCLPLGDCQMLPQDACIAQQGATDSTWSSCDPNPCDQPSQGACCFPGWDCQETSEADCDALGGDWLGEGTDCVINPCIPPDLGACCSPGGRCLLTTQTTCSVLGYHWLGEGVHCEPNPCPQVGIGSGPATSVSLESGCTILTTTWGRIKTTYR